MNEAVWDKYDSRVDDRRKRFDYGVGSKGIDLRQVESFNPNSMTLCGPAT
ncbi:hypothetical protein ACPOL_1256 [Acidisarcina polymorpha]|uniref:Uncharacterized protein n=1 Tax=Acidisarcina polymorpha TaxID=2211140 RepID=A0A2Z5FVT1_9BACT|nr:hypothetical protein ACPOL_1256 [Acidisarcina polymorpha]